MRQCVLLKYGFITYSKKSFNNPYGKKLIMVPYAHKFIFCQRKRNSPLKLVVIFLVSWIKQKIKMTTRILPYQKTRNIYN